MEDSGHLAVDFPAINGVAEEGRGGGGGGGEEVLVQQGRTSLFLELKAYCLDILDLLQNPNNHSSSALSSLLGILCSSSSSSLQPFSEYLLFPLMLLLDAAVSCRSSKQQKSGTEEAAPIPKVTDRVAEGVLLCVEELLKKCQLGSIDQMVAVMKNLTSAAMLSPNEASEEFREGVIKCFRALLVNLLPCSDEACLCRRVSGLPALLERRNMDSLLSKRSKSDLEQVQCLLAYFQLEAASVAVGHWLSLLLKAADTEASRGHRGSGKLRVEAFLTLRVLVAKVGTADALAFFLPGVVSQFSKVLHVSKTMISGAAGSMDALDQAIRGLAEYLMIVLADDSNISSVDPPLNVMAGFNLNKNNSIHSVLDELRQLPINTRDQSESVAKEPSIAAENSVTSASESKANKSARVGKEMGTLHVERTRDWMEKTSAHVYKLLSATFPHICVHPAKKVRQGLVAAIQGLITKCGFTLKESRLMLLECLCVLIVDESEEVSAPAQEFLEFLFSSGGKHHVQSDLAEIFGRLIEKLPKVVLGNEESLALSHAQQLLVVIFYSGPRFVLNHLQSPVAAARFLDVFALCLGQNSVFAGGLDKLILARPSSVGYLPSLVELKTNSHASTDYWTSMDAVSSDILEHNQGSLQNSLGTLLSNYGLPRMPSWFIYVGSEKLYQALAEILRLVGLSLMAEIECEGYMSVVTDIPLGYLRKLVSEIRMKEYSKELWQSWYNRTGSGQLLRQASTAAYILNEMIFGLSDQAIDSLIQRFQRSKVKNEMVREYDSKLVGCQCYTVEYTELMEPTWKASHDTDRSHFIDCIGRILHEYLSSEIWDLPIDHKSSLMQPDGEIEEITLHFFHDTAMLHQVIVDGIGIFAACLGKDFSSSGFLHSSLYVLLESLICSNAQVRSASDAVLHVIAAASGYQTVGQLVLANADYVIDSLCRQLRHLDLNPHAPNVLASMLSYIGVAHKILPLLEEPMCAAAQELEILGRHQHPELTIPFLKAVGEIVKASEREASSLPAVAKSYLMHVMSKISDVEKGSKLESNSEQWENIVFKLNDSKRYRRTVGSIGGSCLATATPLLASTNQSICLVALDIIEDGVATLAKVEEAYRHEKETKEKMEDLIRSSSLYQLQDILDASEEGSDENRLLPAMNKIWPFLVACIRNNNPVAVRRCLSVVANVVQICGGDFFSRRFHTDGPHFWRLLSTSPFLKKPLSKEERVPLQLPYRRISTSLEASVAETSNLKVQVAVLNMIADLSRNKRSASALEVVLKKVSGLVVGIACSGVAGLRDASVNALHGLASIDPDLIWLLLADVYYSMKKKDQPSPPTPDLPQISQILPPPPSPKGYLYVQYGGQSYGFDIDFPSVEAVYKKLHSQVFTDQLYI